MHTRVRDMVMATISTLVEWLGNQVTTYLLLPNITAFRNEQEMAVKWKQWETVVGYKWFSAGICQWVEANGNPRTRSCHIRVTVPGPLVACQRQHYDEEFIIAAGSAQPTRRRQYIRAQATASPLVTGLAFQYDFTRSTQQTRKVLASSIQRRNVDSKVLRTGPTNVECERYREGHHGYRDRTYT
ncbi:hypothetical protein BJV78DRAFT_1152645 [Lactifluus subvellereus]|nr:hypothetical protein BJV78DRAFT_1152645 [Lactifluus subvellereus]